MDKDVDAEIINPSAISRINVDDDPEIDLLLSMEEIDDEAISATLDRLDIEAAPERLLTESESEALLTESKPFISELVKQAISVSGQKPAKENKASNKPKIEKGARLSVEDLKHKSIKLYVAGPDVPLTAFEFPKQKKVLEKTLNLLNWYFESENLNRLSSYTKSALELIVSVKNAGEENVGLVNLIKHYESKGLAKGTAASQAGQMKVLFNTFKVLEGNKINANSSVLNMFANSIKTTL